jgi:hypothetical protein
MSENLKKTVWIPEGGKFHGSAEELVFRLLDRQLGEGWIACHSHEILFRSNRLEMGEIDFLLFHPEKGLFILEVKGGRVNYSPSEGWISKDREGSLHKINPIAQAKGNLEKVMRQMREHLDLPDLTRLPKGFAVIFPHCHFEGALPAGVVYGESNASAGQAIVWDDRCFDDLGERIEKTLSLWSGGKATKAHSGLSERVSSYFTTSTLHVSYSNKAEAALDIERLNEATQSHLKAFEFLSKWNRIRVKGVSGSGKTSLVMKLALKALDEGESVLVLTFNKFLASWIRHQFVGTSSDSLRGNEVAVLHYHGLGYQWATEAGIEYGVGEGESAIEFYSERCAELLMLATEMIPKRFDAILVDEAQDMKSSWWTSIENLLKGDGSTLGIFYDPKQNIYGTKLDFPFEGQEVELNHNLRNPMEIIEAMRGFYEDDVAFPISRDIKGAIETVKIKKGEKAGDIVSDKIEGLISGGVSPSQIVILGRHRFSGSCIHDIEASFSCTTNLNEWLKGVSVLYSTYKGFKGLEADYVFLTEIIEFCEKFPESVYINGLGRSRHQVIRIEEN